jgi:hypothetical protein
MTEKTSKPFVWYQVPIFLGPVGTLPLIREVGYDVFDDIIDHSYQNCETLIERCYWAMERNRHILDDLSVATKLRLQNQDRLIANRNLLLDNQLGKFIDKRVMEFPSDLQQVMPEILGYLRDQDP